MSEVASRPETETRGVARLTGQSRALLSGTSTGTVPRSARRGRPRLITEYRRDQALLNSPAKRWWGLAAVAAAFVFPFVFTGSLYLPTMAIVLAIAGIGLNLLTGYAGQISLGHPFFMALGAYTGAVLAGTPGSTVWGYELDLSIALIAAAVVPAVVGLLVAPLAIRVRGLYLAVLTLGLLMLGEQLFKQWAAVTGGSGVGRAPAQRTLFGTDMTLTYALGPLRLTPSISFYLLCLVLLVLLAVGARNLARSRTGRSFAAVRDRDIAAEIMGVNLLRTKTLAFVLSSAYAGIGGCLMVMLIGRVAPEQWNIMFSIQLLAIVVIGGVATITGTLIGAVFVVMLPELLQSVSTWIPFVSTGNDGLINVFQLQSILFGVLIVVFLILEPRGLFGLWHRIRTFFKAWPFSY